MSSTRYGSHESRSRLTKYPPSSKDDLAIVIFAAFALVGTCIRTCVQVVTLGLEIVHIAFKAFRAQLPPLPKFVIDYFDDSDGIAGQVAIFVREYVCFNAPAPLVAVTPPSDFGDDDDKELDPLGYGEWRLRSPTKEEKEAYLDPYPGSKGRYYVVTIGKRIGVFGSSATADRYARSVPMGHTYRVPERSAALASFKKACDDGDAKIAYWVRFD